MKVFNTDLICYDKKKSYMHILVYVSRDQRRIYDFSRGRRHYLYSILYLLNKIAIVIVKS